MTQARRSLNNMPRGMSGMGEAMMLQRSVERPIALVRLHSVLVRRPSDGSNSAWTGSSSSLAGDHARGAPHTIALSPSARRRFLPRARKPPDATEKGKRRGSYPMNRPTSLGTPPSRPGPNGAPSVVRPHDRPAFRTAPSQRSVKRTISVPVFFSPKPDTVPADLAAQTAPKIEQQSSAIALGRLLQLARSASEPRSCARLQDGRGRSGS